MPSSKLGQSPPPPYYCPLPPEPQRKQDEENCVLLPFYSPAAVCRRQRLCILAAAAAIFFLSLSVYCLWPSYPGLKIVRLRLDGMHIRTVPIITVDVTLGLTVLVCNVDLYSIDYRSVVVSIWYRGKQLGLASSDRGYVRAMGSSYVNATLDLDGVELLSDVILFLDDFSRGSIVFDTVTEVRGRLGLFFLGFPLKAKVSCEVYVDTRNQTITRQNCYPE